MIAGGDAARARVQEIQSRLRVPWRELEYPAAAQPEFLAICRRIAETTVTAPLDQHDGEVRWNARGDIVIGDVLLLADDTSIRFSIDDDVARIFVRTATPALHPLLDRFRDALGGLPFETWYPSDLISVPASLDALRFAANELETRLALVDLHQLLAYHIDGSVLRAAELAPAMRDLIASRALLQRIFGENPIRMVFRFYPAIAETIRRALRQSARPFAVAPFVLLGDGLAAWDEWYERADRNMQTDEVWDRGAQLIAEAYATMDADAVRVMRILTRAQTAGDVRGHGETSVRVQLFLGRR